MFVEMLQLTGIYKFDTYLWVQTEGFCWFSNRKQVKNNFFHGIIKSFLDKQKQKNK